MCRPSNNSRYIPPWHVKKNRAPAIPSANHVIIITEGYIDPDEKLRESFFYFSFFLIISAENDDGVQFVEGKK